MRSFNVPSWESNKKIQLTCALKWLYPPPCRSTRIPLFCKRGFHHQSRKRSFHGNGRELPDRRLPPPHCRPALRPASSCPPSSEWPPSLQSHLLEWLIVASFVIIYTPSSLSFALHHAIRSPYHDDSVHADVSTTTPTPQTSSTTRWWPPVMLRSWCISSVCEIFCQ